MRNLRACALALLCLFSFSAFAQNWTVLVYLNGFNDLDSAGALNLNQMETVGSSANVNVVVEWGSFAAPKSTKRMLMQKDSDPKKVTSPVLEELGKVDMGDPATLKEFLLWGIHRFPADHYLVVVWDHGTGWHLVRPRASRIGPQDISWDDISGNVISTEDLGHVLREVSQEIGKKIDLYASDACLMAMAEVAGEMHDAVDFFAGSQELEPETGWPYDRILAELVSHPEMRPAELGDLIARSYVELNEGEDDATFSVYDMNHYVQFEEAVLRLADGIAGLSKSERMATLALVKQSQSYYGDYGDLGDFVRRLQLRGAVSGRVLANVQHALQNLVIANYMTERFPNTRGLSLWLPPDRKTYRTYSDRYSGLGFERRTRWSRAIEAYLN